MEEEKLFNMVRKLCIANGKAIDRISHECNVNQNLVAKLFMETMNMILVKVKSGKVDG